jgi:predicted RNA-binding protein with TRAM domain
MGIYDTYDNIQLKVGELTLTDYEIGDKTDLHDGIYVAPDGIVVIVAGVFVATFDHMVDKWGNNISIGDVISE